MEAKLNGRLTGELLTIEKRADRIMREINHAWMSRGRKGEPENVSRVYMRSNAVIVAINRILTNRQVAG